MIYSIRFKKSAEKEIEKLPASVVKQITPAIDVHHIDSFMNYEGLKRVEKAFNSNNLQSIC